MPSFFPFRLYPKRGFTLIELMVSITILAIISAVGFATYSNSQVIARDGKRKQDLRQIATALELYYQQNKHYPCTLSTVASGWVFSSSTPSFWITNNVSGANATNGCQLPAANTFDSNYISNLPVDPKSNGGQPYQDNQYGYAYWASTTTSGSCPTVGAGTGQTFVLVTQLENKSDPDRIGNRNFQWCGANLYISGGTGFIPSQYSYVLTNAP